VVAAIAPNTALIPLVSGTSLLFLALLGGLAARAGGAGVTLGANARYVLACASHGGDRGRRGTFWDNWHLACSLRSRNV
jgi:hypothetical protein